MPESTALQTAEKQEVSSIYQVFRQMALDPSIDPARIGALMELQFKAEERQAEREFNAAFAALLPKLPRIVKRGTINLVKDGISKGSIPFARYEDVDAALRPMYTEAGFSLSFQSRPTEKGILLVALLAHASGHAKTSELQLPPDAGAGRNALQALGSALSYAKRYLTCDLFNIVTVGEDDDGAGFGSITEFQQKTLAHAIQMVGANEAKLLEIYGAKALSDIPKSVYHAVQKQLEAKWRLKWKNEGADDQECNERCAELWK